MAEVRPEVEEVVLDLLQPAGEPVGMSPWSGRCHAEGGVQLVHSADRFDARVGLRYSAEVSEMCLAIVAQPGVRVR